MAKNKNKYSALQVTLFTNPKTSLLVRSSLIAVVLSVVGVLFVQVSGAAPNRTGSQPAATAAINSPSLPAIIKAATGGDSIALVWTASQSPSVKGYEVYRNGSRVASVIPGSGLTKFEKEGRLYVDTAVKRGTTYQYQLKTIASDGTASALSASVAAKHPNSTTPMPRISFEYIRAQPAASVPRADIEAYFKKQIQLWYPKIGDALAYPAYAPRSSIIVETNPDISLAGVAGNRFGYNPQWLDGGAGRLDDLMGGVLAHELTHMVNDHGGHYRPVWFTEGMGNWTRQALIPIDQDILNRPMVNPLFNAAELAKGYDPGAAFIYYIQKTYKASFPRDISIAVHNGTYNDNFLRNATGKTEAQLIEELRVNFSGGTGALINGGGRCAEVSNGSTANGTRLQITSCDGSAKQNWTTQFAETNAQKDPAKGFWLTDYQLGVSNCMDVAFSGISSGTKLHYWSCNYGNAQRWVTGANNSLVNPNSGKCLGSRDALNDDGVELVIADCDGSANQSWMLPTGATAKI